MFSNVVSCDKHTCYIFGNWKINLYSDKKVPHPTFVSSSINNYLNDKELILPDLSVNIWYSSISQKWEDIFQILKNGSKRFVPYGLNFFYSALDMANIPHLPIEKHCNRYYKFNDYILGEFPYETDRFKIVCNTKTGDLYLCGPETSIYRILCDCISVLSKSLPVHGCAAEKNNKAVCILGDSGSGKTFLLLLMIKMGFSFISDDELYISGNTIYSISNVVKIRNESVSIPSFQSQYSHNQKIVVLANELGWKSCRSAKIKKYYTISNHNNINFLQWFPSVAHQSYWWLTFLDDKSIDTDALKRKIVLSKVMVKNILEQNEIFHVNFDKVNEFYNNCSYDFEEVISNVLFTT